MIINSAVINILKKGVQGRMNQIFKNIFLLAILLFIFSCSNDENKYFLTEDILSTFQILEKNHETKIIDFADNSSRNFLISGWSGKEKEFTWAIGNSSKFFFYSVGPSSDMGMTISCAPILTPYHYNQEISISVNGKYADTIKLANKSDFKEYRVLLPKSVLKLGKNSVLLNFSYCTRPASNNDNRFLSVMFKSISFGNADAHQQSYFVKHKKDVISQYPGSYFTYATQFKKNDKIFIDYEITGDAKAYVKFTTSDNITKIKPLPLEKNHVIYKIPGSNNAPVKLDFIVFPGTEPGHLKWKHIGIYRTAENKVQANNKSPFVKEGYIKENKPDIIFYVIDALRSDHLGCYGYDKNTTPNIDKFAAENTLFKNAYANASWTRASGATILTGLLAKRHNTMARDSKLSKDLVTLPEKLKENGYYTVAFITNGNICQVFGFDQGFDEFNYFGESLKREDIHFKSDKLNNKIFDFVNKYKKIDKSKPLFLFIWSTDPHDPYTPDKSVSKNFNINEYEPVENKYRNCSELKKRIDKNKAEGKYYAKCTDHMQRNFKSSKKWPSDSQVQYLMTLYDQEILFNDISFGKLMNKLKEEGLYDNSIIILTADHGEEFEDHGWFAHGVTLYNEVIKIPMIFKAPRIKKGTFYEMTQLADIYPTILDILNLNLPYEIDGKSFIENYDFRHRAIYSEEILDGHNFQAVITNGNKFIKNIKAPPYYHLTRCNNEAYEIYDLSKDKKETNNISNKRKVLSSYLAQKLNIELSDIKKSVAFKTDKANISPELDEKLRQLGYAK